MNTEEYIKERDEALKKLDLVWARANMPVGVDDDQLINAMHKARYEILSMPDELRHESRAWLEAHGYSRMMFLDWPPEGELPRE